MQLRLLIAFKRYFLSPLLYALSAVGVFVLVGAALAFLERFVRLHTWRRVGDVDAVVALVTIGIPIFLIVTRALIRLDGLHRPRFHAHFRHCALLYVAAILLVAALVVYYQSHNTALQYAYLAGVFASCALAILVNGTTLFRHSTASVEAQQCAPADDAVVASPPESRLGFNVRAVKMSIAAGWLAIALALFALAPSFVPGAFSVFGLLISLTALIVSVFSVKEKGKKYFTITMIIVLISVFLVNDGLRIWQPLEMPIYIKLSLYGIFCFVVMVCAFLVARLAPVRNNPNSRTQEGFPNE